MAANKSSFKTPTQRQTKRVTFQLNEELPTVGLTSDRLEAAMRAAAEVGNLEESAQDLLREVKNLFVQYQDQSLMRFNVEKTLADQSLKGDKSLAGAEEKRKRYFDLINSNPEFFGEK